MTEGPRTGPQGAESLLDRIWDTALEDEYYAPHDRPPRRARALSAVTMLAFGLLIATAAVQTRVGQPASDLERAAVISDIDQREDLVASQRARIEELTAEVEGLRTEAAVPGAGGEQGAIAAAAMPVEGPGITVTATSGEGVGGEITDQDLQLLANGLWYAGAEAVSINGQRLASTTAIRWAGESVTVNFRPINEPYEIAAIGPASLGERLRANPSGRHWDHRSAESGVSWTIEEAETLRLPAAPDTRLRLNQATKLEEAP
ncbi:hypothetical protein BHE97_06200 [Aeromicrobium sp. PE09-221]|uniref:DUF881 domain-containing protein n=1 Tax=Aeromicrobium sp. PE09-221 TaxID=1898043 RepID=UPI000B3E52D3|nr:DUF881 domain-containing protein [Aeromicrobium sp. PE09-221]OUZ11020.1 hypothetical protein BHE97_06200 [Aeromicrobium sp. PE09-221]